MVVVGARCAGAPLAALLARQGVKVAVVEQATFPRDTLSSHVFEADALAFLDRLGITERLKATGAPLMRRQETRVEDVDLSGEWPQRPGDVGGITSIRRLVLDPILGEAAEEAGAEVRMGAKVTGLLHDNGRVTGVRVSGDDGEVDVQARLVVGADGRSSTVARQTGAATYNVTSNERILYWTFFEGVDPGPEPAFIIHRWADRFVFGMPSDSGLYQGLVWPEMHERERFRADLEGAFMEQIRSCEPVAERIAGARRVGKFFGAVRWNGFFREASGPGWVLTGDAGHFKSPAPGRGIGDAFLQAEKLAPAIVAGLGGSEEDLDQEMASFGRWRDKEFAEHYWFALDMEQAGPVPPVLTEILRGLKRRGKQGLFFDLLNHRTKPSQVLTPPRILGATTRLVARRGPAILGEVGRLGAQDMRRRRLNRRPAYAPPGDASDARAADEDAAVSRSPTSKSTVGR